MPVFNNILAGASAQADSSYQIDQSLRFRQAATLDRGNFTSTATWTFSVWFKPKYNYDGRGSQMTIIGSQNIHVHLENDILHFRNNSSNAGTVGDWRAGRDQTAWHHLVINQTSGSVNAKAYINGVEVTDGGANNWTVDNVRIGGRDTSGNASFTGYMAEAFFFYGTSRPPTDFAEYNSDGVWVPKDLASDLSASDYGSDGGYYKFEDRTNIGNDSSGNNNDLSVQGTFNASEETNFSNDVLVLDTPTNNFCTLHTGQCSPGSTYNHGLAGMEIYTHDGAALGTHRLTTGKWYWELNNVSGNAYVEGGVFRQNLVRESNDHMDGANPTNPNFGGDHFFGYHSQGHLMTHLSDTSYGVGWDGTNDILNIAFDVDNRKMWFGRNGVWMNSGDPANGTNPSWSDSNIPALNSDRADYWVPYIVGKYNSTVRVNFGQIYMHNGQRVTDLEADSGVYSFKWAPPTGFKSICTKNMPEMPIKQPNKHFDAIKYTCNNKTAQTISGLNFQPDLILFKSEHNGAHHYWWDSTRGFTEVTKLDNATRDQDSTVITGVTSTGFVLGTDTNNRDINSGTGTTFAQCWKAGGAPTATNTATSGAMADGSVFVDGSASNSYTPSGSPSIYPQMMSVNTVGKIAVIKYEGTGTAGTIPHGLGVRPSMIIYKGHTNADEWTQWYDAVGANRRLDLSNRFQGNNDNFFNNNSINCDQHHFHVGTDTITNSDGVIYTAYVFADVEGFQQHGEYVGDDAGGSNGFVDGRALILGFKPNTVWFRDSDGSSVDPILQARVMTSDGGKHNYLDGCFKAGDGITQALRSGTNNAVDFHATGVKIVNSSQDWLDNSASSTWAFSAWADQPFGGSNVSPATAF